MTSANLRVPTLRNLATGPNDSVVMKPYSAKCTVIDKTMNTISLRPISNTAIRDTKPTSTVNTNNGRNFVSNASKLRHPTDLAQRRRHRRRTFAVAKGVTQPGACGNEVLGGKAKLMISNHGK